MSELIPTRRQVELLQLLSDGDPKHESNLGATTEELAALQAAGWVNRVSVLGAVWITDAGRRAFVDHFV